MEKGVHTETIKLAPGTIHVLLLHYLSGSESDVLGYFDNQMYAHLAFEFEAKRHNPKRHTVLELKPIENVILVLQENMWK